MNIEENYNPANEMARNLVEKIRATQEKLSKMTPQECAEIVKENKERPTAYERMIQSLPERLTAQKEEKMYESLNAYLNSIEHLKYLILMTPYSDQNYITMFVVDKKINVADDIISFFKENVGTIQHFDYQRNHRIDVYANNQMYSLFNYNAGVVELS